MNDLVLPTFPPQFCKQSVFFSDAPSRLFVMPHIQRLALLCQYCTVSVVGETHAQTQRRCGRTGADCRDAAVDSVNHSRLPLHCKSTQKCNDITNNRSTPEFVFKAIFLPSSISNFNFISNFTQPQQELTEAQRFYQCWYLQQQ